MYACEIYHGRVWEIDRAVVVENRPNCGLFQQNRVVKMDLAERMM